MGLGFSLRGRIGGQEDWLTRAGDWMAEQEEGDIVVSLGRNDDNQPILYLDVHPSAENAEIRLVEPGVIVASAKTSTTGPGYHIFLCDLLQRLGEEMAVEWQPGDDDSGDETGYFESGDREALEQEMLTWLQAMARFVAEHEGSDFKIAMPMEHSYTGYGNLVLTPLGPRDRDWFAAVADDPKQGVDFFSWWEAELDARYYRDRALCVMWREVRWRPPVDEDESELLTDVACWLEAAYDLDHAGLEMPWAEWHEILTNLDEHDTDPKLTELIAKRASQASAARIGYRRGPVKVQVVAGWSIEIPGSFAEQWDEEGKTWSAWEEGRSILLSSFTMGAERSAEECLQLLPPPGDGERLDHRHKQMVGQAVWGPGENDEWQLQAVTATTGGAALVTIAVDDASGKDWALHAWHSLQHQSEPGASAPGE